MAESQETTRSTLEEEKDTAPPQSEEITQAKKEKSKEKQPEKKRYKILAGNGCHRAICEVQGMLIPPTEEGGKFQLILPDGLQVDAMFKTSRQHWLAMNQGKRTHFFTFRLSR